MSAPVEVCPVVARQSAFSIANRSKRSSGIIMRCKHVEVSRSEIAGSATQRRSGGRLWLFFRLAKNRDAHNLDPVIGEFRKPGETTLSHALQSGSGAAGLTSASERSSRQKS